MKNNVLFISNHAGFSKFNIPYLNYLLKNNIDVYNASPGIEVKFEGVHVDFPISRNPIALTNVTAFIRLLKFVRTNDIRNIHCHTPTGGMLGRCLKLFRPNLKIIYTAHGFHFFKGASILNWLIFFPVEYLLSFLTNAIVTINNEDYEIAKKYFHSKIYKIDGVGVDLNKFYPDKEIKIEGRKKLNIDDQALVFIYAAQFIKRKNHIFLLESFKKHVENNRSSYLILAGDGPLFELIKEKVKELELDNHVCFLGYKRNIEFYYRISDVLVSVSKQEGFPMNLVEGLSSGLTLIVSNIRGHRDILEKVPDHHLFDFNVSQLADIFDKIDIGLVKDNSQINKNSKLSMQFNLDQSINKMKEVYNQEFYFDL